MARKGGGKASLGEKSLARSMYYDFTVFWQENEPPGRKSLHLLYNDDLSLPTCERPEAVGLVDVPELELGVRGGGHQVGAVQELDIADSLAVALEHVQGLLCRPEQEEERKKVGFTTKYYN